nr:MAG TPA: hypothetical protein [Caudoviricetes sp.]
MDMPPNLSTTPRTDGAAAGGIPLPGPPENIGRSTVGRRNETVASWPHDNPGETGPSAMVKRGGNAEKAVTHDGGTDRT